MERVAAILRQLYALVDELASVSGDTILPFFRTALGVEDKSGTGKFDPAAGAIARRRGLCSPAPQPSPTGRDGGAGSRSGPI